MTMHGAVFGRLIFPVFLGKSPKAVSNGHHAQERDDLLQQEWQSTYLHDPHAGSRERHPSLLHFQGYLQVFKGMALPSLNCESNISLSALSSSCQSRRLFFIISFPHSCIKLTVH
jgi:hypothetical protein